ncbi:hypothetical protein G7B40_021835 [Aetokthonos hydrillicola Thurmond2011]|jgi:hypothetical protein|uniref:Uncharacterized protein n=1 Tax=Aetokthonos hydrillicola Thurmond2011 TaxID=2712845 RepID=A0AAP5M9F7_9CYAN|nr:hypothetical protein [Aetokthonos hydrillicola]MBO3457809.1 hypothetical protein [Aetokthonos hydrillicola CCALA 1050]MBW4588333.1 hypothetical protein [Aetokthonos hydrillicola CCALA 1050]MDR9897185.1 hypothetical protein [Aetokthonos hydrillicola Thurmond2011]
MVNDEQKPSPEEKSLNNQASYSEKTHRLLAVSQFLKSISPIIWTVVILIVVVSVWGRISIGSIGGKYISKPSSDTTHGRVVITVPSVPPQINRDVILALKNARASSEKYASEKLDEWMNRLKERVDNDFLNWYFNYFTQLDLGFQAMITDFSSAIARSFNPNQPTAQEQKAQKITEEFQREFTRRVLKPEIAQIKLERFTRETINTYVSKLSEQLAGIQSEYKIPQADWERYLSGVSTTILDSTGNNQDLSLRVLSRGTEYLVALPLSKATVKLGSGLATKFAETAATKAGAKITAKISTKAAGKVATEFSLPTLSTIGLELIDPLAAVGILAWDIWDNYHTAQIERPKMREAILEYLDEMKQVLLYNPHDSIMSTIYSFEGSLIDKLAENKVNNNPVSAQP